jgi:hypothetical protein
MSPMLLLSNPQAVKAASWLRISKKVRSYPEDARRRVVGGKAEGHGVRLRIAATFGD